METVKSLFWKIYLQFLFLIGAFQSKRTWIDKHILLCYDKLDQIGSPYQYRYTKKDQLE